MRWQPGGKKMVLDTYLALHKDKRIGEHWAWVAVSRIAAGEPEEAVMADYGYRKVGAGKMAPWFTAQVRDELKHGNID